MKAVLFAWCLVFTTVVTHGQVAPVISSEFDIAGPIPRPYETRIPAIASNGTNWLVMWHKGRAQGLGGALIGSNGEFKTNFNFPLISAGIPVVASDGHDYFVAWGDYLDSSLHAVRISGDGVLLSSVGFLVYSGLWGEPKIACNGTNYLVIWEDSHFYPTNFNIFGVLCDPTGTVVSRTNPIPISINLSNQFSPTVASDGSDFLVVWEDERNWNISVTDIFGARVNGVGDVLDRSGIPICTYGEFQGFPIVGSNGRDYFVTWQDRRNLATSGWSIFGAHVSRMGTAAVDVAVSNWIYDQEYPNLAACGESYLVAWRDWSKGFSLDSRLRGAWVTNGKLLDPDGFLINDSAGNQNYPAVSYRTDGQLLIANQGWRDNNNHIVGNIISVPDWQPKLCGITAQSNHIALSWFADTSKSYRVQYRTNLTSGNWEDLPGTITATKSVAEKNDTTMGMSPERFYRVVLLP